MPQAVSEDDLHIGLAQWLELSRLPMWWWHTANESNVPPQYRAKLKKKGVKPGIPDFCFLSSIGLFASLELKKADGDVKAAQVAWDCFCGRALVPHKIVFSNDLFFVIEETKKLIRRIGVRC